MKVKETLLSIATVLILCFLITFPTASAHTGGVFTIIVSENGVVPGNVQMLVNDTARWINVDDTNNVTHRIMVDFNSNGEYDDVDDFDSGNLTHQCEHINGTKVDENCNAYFDIPFNETYLNMSYFDIVKTYAFVDLVHNETSGITEKVYGNVTVNPDAHLTAGFQGTTSDNDKSEDKDEDETSNFLLLVAAASGIGAIVLGGMILFGNKE
ncbi:MAG: hypothetical protein BEU00_00350 [Marine Group III euryarchaeote CG-Epi3]|jgi:hypothetical protein|uniref:Uncharacterized protein n=1 Tax=Marine Group III euryarchaeote CG-Epi3 TaxID=1888997 RepID=A0A1J5TQX4_9ARCH|nr:MAG: hypothetical protein BEU00_00350 [Marine Group III euryarchaeote CG-Epi3]|tara:strand:- start:1680 stop:2312 length:633 start_codon:yes stop_codon:yes gene_type:complete